MLNTFLTSILYFILLNRTHYQFYKTAPPSSPPLQSESPLWLRSPRLGRAHDQRGRVGRTRERRFSISWHFFLSSYSSFPFRWERMVDGEGGGERGLLPRRLCWEGLARSYKEGKRNSIMHSSSTLPPLEWNVISIMKLWLILRRALWIGVSNELSSERGRLT